MIEKTETRVKLIKTLFSIWDNRDFVIGINSHLINDDECKKVLDFIEENKDEVTRSDITYFAFVLDQIRDGSHDIDEFYEDDLVIDDFSIIAHNVEVKDK